MSTTADLLSPEQLRARAKARREIVSSSITDDGHSPWPLVVEGWRGDRQVFGLGLTSSEQLAPAVLSARSAFGADQVVVISDARMLTYQPGDVEGQRVQGRYTRGEVTLLELARQGDPRVLEQVTILPFTADKGVQGAQMLRYLSQYTFGRETGIIWDVETETPALADTELRGGIPSALEWSMKVMGLGADGRPFAVDDGGVLAWERLDAEVLESISATLGRVTRGHFVILNAHPRITAAAGLSEGSSPTRVAAGTREPEALVQLVAKAY